MLTASHLSLQMFGACLEQDHGEPASDKPLCFPHPAPPSQQGNVCTVHLLREQWARHANLSADWLVLLCLCAGMLVWCVSLLLLGPIQQVVTYAMSMCGHAGVIALDACPPASGSLSSV